MKLEVSPCKKASMQPSTLKKIKKKLKSGKAFEMSTWRLERRRVAFQLARFLPGRVRLIRFKNLKNVQFTTKAVSNLQDQVKKKNFILRFWSVSTAARISIGFSDLLKGRLSHLLSCWWPSATWLGTILYESIQTRNTEHRHHLQLWGVLCNANYIPASIAFAEENGQASSVTGADAHP